LQLPDLGFTLFFYNLEIIQMTSRGPNLPPISYLHTSGGQLRDQTVHFFDLLRWISEDEPEEVYVFGAALVDPKVAEVGDIDTSIVAIRLSRGTLCQIDCSRRTGSGWIAERFIESVRAHTKQDIVAVGSRNKDRAEEFALRMLTRGERDGATP
jgi:predicted dehydrogenase